MKEYTRNEGEREGNGESFQDKKDDKHRRQMFERSEQVYFLLT